MNLKNKKIIILGDSISDNRGSVYKPKPTFYCEMIQKDYNATIYNHAIGGATVCFSYERAYMGNIFATNVVRQKETIEDIKKSDICFFMIGTNDFTCKVEIGNKNDIDDNNYLTKESFVGGYYDVINNIRKHNKNIKIYCFSLFKSSWGYCPNYEAKENVIYAKKRDELNQIIKDICQEFNLIYVDVYNNL